MTTHESHEQPEAHGLDRASFLRLGMTATAAAGLGAAGAGCALAQDTPAEGESGGFPPVEPAPGRRVERIGPITGPDVTTRFRMERADLGVPARCPDGRVLYVFGDSFEHARTQPDNFWRSPTGLYTDGADPDGGIRWQEAVGGQTAERMIDYVQDGPDIATAIPSDVMTIGDVMYLQVWCCQPRFPILKRTEIWRSEDSGATWQRTPASWPADFHGGIFQLITWHPHPDGHVYIYSSAYRTSPLYMWRVPVDQVEDPAAYQSWGWSEASGWQWGQDPSPIRPGKYGEMTLRPVGEGWMLTFFQDPNDPAKGEDFPNPYSIQALFFDEPWSDLTTARCEVLLHGCDWGQESADHVAQLYGGYIVPGSTPDDLHLTVSQWNTAEDWPYHVEHVRLRGFDVPLT